MTDLPPVDFHGLLSYQCTGCPNCKSPSLDRVAQGLYPSHRERYAEDTPRITQSPLWLKCLQLVDIQTITRDTDLDYEESHVQADKQHLEIWIQHQSLTISNNRRTSFSDSPLYLEVRVEEETLKKVVPHSVATALASIVLPVPGGPTISTPWNFKMN